MKTSVWTLILGILQSISGFREFSGGTRILLIILGVVMVWIGRAALKNPIEARVVLTLAVAMAFAVSGVAKIILGFHIRGSGFGIWVIRSGIRSLALGVMFMGNLIGTAPWLLGVLLGIELISDGVAAIALWSHRKNA